MTGAGAVLVARLDNAGDVLLAGPAVRACAASGRPVHLLCGPRGRAAADLLPGLAGVVEFHAPWIEATPMAVRHGDAAALVERLRALGIADAAVLGSSHQSPLPLALLLRWAGVGRIAAVSHDHAGSLLDVRLRGDPDIHEVRRGLLVTEALGFRSPADDRLRVDPGPPDAGVARLVGRLGRFVVVHPGASVTARTLAPAQWRDAVAALAAEGRRVAVTGGPQEVGLTATVAGDHPRVTDLGGLFSLRRLAHVLAAADVVAAGNTGPAHLAAAVGTPVVAAFPPTVPLDRWRPWRVPQVVLGDQDVPCAGCRARSCPLPEQVCTSGVRGADVAAAVDRLAPLAARAVPEAAP